MGVAPLSFLSSQLLHSHILKASPSQVGGISPLPRGQGLCIHLPSERVPATSMLGLLGGFVERPYLSGTPHASMRGSQFVVEELSNGFDSLRDSQDI